MLSSKHVMLCCLGLVIACGDGAASEPEAKPQSAAASDSQPLGQVSSNIPWDTIQWIEPRYKIEALRFKARDESGIDWWGSDEVMIRTDDAKGWTFSDEIGGIDSGDTHDFDPARSCIIAVPPGIVVLGKTSVCNDGGEPAPLWFEVEFWEKDIGRFPLIGFEGIACGSGHHQGPHCRRDGDDFLGRARIDLTQQDLDGVLRSVGDEYVETVVLNPCSGANVCDVTYGPDYSFTYRITRLPDVQVGLHGVLDEAMLKIGARSELEAIVAGLRALRAPSPRQVEPKSDLD